MEITATPPGRDLQWHGFLIFMFWDMIYKFHVFALSAITDIAQLISMDLWQHILVNLIGQMSCDHTFQCTYKLVSDINNSKFTFVFH